MPSRLNGVRGAGSQGGRRDKDLYGQAEDACCEPMEFAALGASLARTGADTDIRRLDRTEQGAELAAVRQSRKLRLESRL